MTANTSLEQQVRALRRGGAFVDLAGWRKVEVVGGDADRWLNDLVSAELGGLVPGRAVRSLLLSPTGRIRAAFTVARMEQGWLLVQDPVQPSPLDLLLERYVLSSDVAVEDRTAEVGILAMPGPETPAAPRSGGYLPSALGEGLDLVGDDRSELAAAVGDRTEALADAVEVWRIERGTPRFGIDLDEDSLPHETPLESGIAYAKGCFLGQEAVAKVRNLGHPPSVIRSVRADAAFTAGEEVLVGDESVGRITSAAWLPEGGSAGIARIRWAAREAGLRTASGVPLSVSAAAGAP